MKATGKRWKLPYRSPATLGDDFAYLTSDTPDWNTKPYLKTAIKSHLVSFGYQLKHVDPFVESKYA